MQAETRVCPTSAGVQQMSTSTLKSYLAGLLSVPSSPSLYWYWRLSWPWCRTLHVALLNLIGSHRPTTWACSDPSGWHPVPQACQPPHSAWCHLQVCWGCTWVHVIDEDIKRYWSQYGPLRDTTCHQCPCGHQDVDHCPPGCNHATNSSSTEQSTHEIHISPI